MLTLDKIYHAAFVLKDVARKTDLIEAPKLSKDCQLYLKTENLQATGSFKVRGAYYKISQLSPEESAKGVIACSAGNHAQGVISWLLIWAFSSFRPVWHQEHRLHAGRCAHHEGGKYQEPGCRGLPCARHLR